MTAVRPKKRISISWPEAPGERRAAKVKTTLRYESQGERFAAKAMANLTDQELEFDDVVSPIFSGARGKRLARVRRAMNLSQSELAIKLGISQKTLSRIEVGGEVYCSPKLTAAVLRRALHGSGLKYVLFGRHGYQFEKPGADADWVKRTANPGNRTPGSERIMATKWAQDEGRKHVAKLLADRRKKSD